MRGSVESYPRAAVERAMKVQEVILCALARKITWWHVAEIIDIRQPGDVVPLQRRWSEDRVS